MVAVVCDRCGATMPASGKIGYITWNFWDGLDGEPAGGNVLAGRHFCRSCMEAVMGFIESAPGTAGGREDGRRQKRVDAGRVMALKGAGWNAGKIADDMGISLQSVYRVFRDHGGDGTEGADNG